MNRIIMLLLAMAVMSCSKSLDIKLEPEVQMLLSNDTEQRISLTEKDEAYVSLNEWLHENQTGWYATSGHYPGGVYVKSGEYGIQVTKSKVIIYSTVSSKPKAIYVQDIAKGELNKIVNFRK